MNTVETQLNSIDELHVTMKVTPITERKYMPVPFGSRHYKILLQREGTQATFLFSMGSAHNRQPQLLEVLESLLLDYRGAEDTFERFCQDFGYEYNSEEAKRVWKACQKNSEKMDNLFSDIGMGDLQDLVFAETAKKGA